MESMGERVSEKVIVAVGCFMCMAPTLITKVGPRMSTYVEYCMHGHNCNINHEFSTMAFNPPHLPNHSSAYAYICTYTWEV